MCISALAGLCGCGKSPTAPPCTTCDPVQPVAITCPSDVSVTAPSFLTTSMPVPFSTIIVTGGTPPVTSSCSATSNSDFPGGTTQVSCKATDAIGRQAVCSFNVTVIIPPAPIPKLQGTTFV